MDLTVVVASYGDMSWRTLADGRAVPSAQALDVPVVQVHGATLHGARNGGLDQVASEWVAFLDADDELEQGYIEAMAGGDADVRAPAVRYIQGGVARQPAMPRVAGHTHACVAGCLAYGNWLVVGAAVRADLVRKVGGWRDFPIYEDWDLWVRCWQTGATFEPVPRAIYRAHVRPRSRNRAAPREQRLAAHRAIARANGVPVP